MEQHGVEDSFLRILPSFDDVPVVRLRCSVRSQRRFQIKVCHNEPRAVAEPGKQQGSTGQQAPACYGKCHQDLESDLTSPSPVPWNSRTCRWCCSLAIEFRTSFRSVQPACCNKGPTTSWVWQRQVRPHVWKARIAVTQLGWMSLQCEDEHVRRSSPWLSTHRRLC